MTNLLHLLFCILFVQTIFTVEQMTELRSDFLLSTPKQLKLPSLIVDRFWHRPHEPNNEIMQFSIADRGTNQPTHILSANSGFPPLLEI
jgi:hypothetical protein